MSCDKLCRNEILRGRVLLCISLAADEVASLDAPLPILLLVSRSCYLPSLYEEICAYFAEYTINSAKQVWFTREGLPIPWQHPIGKTSIVVLFRYRRAM
jgi:hypothetical protein